MLNFLFECVKIKEKYTRDEVSVYAAQASFFIVLAVFPFLMVLLTLVQVIPAVSKADVMSAMVALSPDMLAAMVVSVVDDLYTKSPGTILSVSGIAALWSSSRGMLSLERGLNRVYETPEKRGYFLSRFICTLYTVVFMVICVSALALLVFGSSLYRFAMQNWPLLEDLTKQLIDFRNLLSLVLFFLFFLGLYTFLPKKKQKLREQVPGAVFATFGWLIFSYLFSIYFNSFSNFSYMYGSLTAIVLLMLWLYFCLCIVLIGAELNFYYSNHQNS